MDTNMYLTTHTSEKTFVPVEHTAIVGNVCTHTRTFTRPNTHTHIMQYIIVHYYIYTHALAHTPVDVDDLAYARHIGGE